MKKAPQFTRKPLVQAVTAAALAFAGQTALAACPDITNVTAAETGPCQVGSGQNAYVAGSGQISGGSTAIYVNGGTAAGSISNVGALYATTTAIGIYSASSATSVVNSGFISVGAVGIGVYSSSAVSGNVVNEGTIQGGTKGIVVSGSNVGGDVGNTLGTINVASTSVLVTSSTVTGNVVNGGNISVGADALKVNNSTVGGVSSTGVVVVSSNVVSIGNSTVNGDVGISNFNIAGGDAIYIDNTDVWGNVSNAGFLAAGSADGIHIVNSSYVAGSVSNENVTMFASYGIVVSDSFAGSVSNVGNIYAANTGINLTTNSYIGGDVLNQGIISASAGNGILGYDTYVIGDISNTGTITANTGGKAGIYFDTSYTLGSIVNDGTINGSNGIYINDSYVWADVRNDGNGIINAPSGITIANSSDVLGNVVNNGTITGQYGINIVSSATIWGSVSNGGTINSTVTGIYMYQSGVFGDLVNTGTINGNGTGIYLTTNSYIVGDVVNSGTISGGNYSIYVDGSSSLSAIDIVGTSAHLIGNVFAQNTDVNITSGAVFTSEGSFDIDQFNIASGAVFNMANSITSGGGVSNSGMLSIADGTSQTITGNYTQNPGGVLQVGALSAGSYGQLVVSGNADLGTSATIDLNLTNGYFFANGDVLNNVLSAGSLTAGTLTVTDNSLLWDFTAVDDGANGIDVTAGTNTAAAAQACGNTYCEGAARTIINQVGAGNPVFAPYGTLPDSNALKVAASQATPELINENIHVLGTIADSILDIVQNHGGNTGGASSGDAMTGEPDKVWFKPYFIKDKQDHRNTVEGYDNQGEGMVIGADTMMSDWMVGGALAYGTNELDGNGNINGQSINSDVYQGVVYGHKDLGDDTHVSVQGLLGYSDNDSQRHISLLGETAKGSYDSWFSELRGEVGRDYQINNEFSVTPSLSADYIYVTEDGFTEHGSSMDLHVHEHDNDSLTLNADADASYTLPTTLVDQYLVLTGHLGLGYDVLDSQSSVKSNFVAGGGTFTTNGIDYDGVVFRGGVGLKVINDIGPLSGSVNYDVQNGNDANSSIVSASVKYKF